MARKRNTTKGVIEPVKQNIIQRIKDRRNKERKDLPRGLQIDTTTGEGANITKMKEGGICRGAGAAIKGTDFKGVF